MFGYIRFQGWMYVVGCSFALRRRYQLLRDSRRILRLAAGHQKLFHGTVQCTVAFAMLAAEVGAEVIVHFEHRVVNNETALAELSGQRFHLDF